MEKGNHDWKLEAWMGVAGEPWVTVFLVISIKKVKCLQQIVNNDFNKKKL
jgi:hypothetical protein